MGDLLGDAVVEPQLVQLGIPAKKSRLVVNTDTPPALSPLLAKLEGVAPLEALVGLAVLVQVGGRHVAALVLAAHHRDLALLHLEEHAAACGGQQVEYNRDCRNGRNKLFLSN